MMNADNLRKEKFWWKIIFPQSFLWIYEGFLVGVNEVIDPGWKLKRKWKIVGLER